MRKLFCLVLILVLLAACSTQQAAPPDNQQPPPGETNRVPIAALAASSFIGTAPLTVTFTAQAADPDGDPLTYAWSFGDGATAPSGSSSNQTHTYTTPGDYVAAVTVSDGRGGAATAAVGISVFAPPVTTGSLSVNVAGVDKATVTVTGPGGFSQTRETPASFTNLAPGTYTITPALLEGYTTAPAQAVVSTGQHSNVTITYTRNIDFPEPPPPPGEPDRGA